MSNNKQSSIEWLEAELKKIPFVKVDEVFKQAKAMHKQEIIDAYHTNPLEAKWQNKGFQYYNETFGGNNEQQ